MPIDSPKENGLAYTIPLDNPVVDVLPDPIAALSAFAETVVLTGLANSGTQQAYRVALTRLFKWMTANAAPFDRASVQAYLAHLADLSMSSRNVALAAAKKLAREAYYAGRLAFEVYQGVNDIKGSKAHASKAPNWLTKGQLADLLAMPGKNLHGRRDRALLATIAGCGLRRAELCSLTIGSMEQRAARWVFIVKGKGSKIRLVPIPSGVKVCIDEWIDFRRMLTTVGDGSFLFVPVLQGDNIKERRMNEQSIYNIVKEYGERLGVPTLAPHDLRRTHARLGRDAGADLDQIQAGLGHASVTTTQAYVGGNQDLHRAPGDMIDVDWAGKEGNK